MRLGCGGIWGDGFWGLAGGAARNPFYPACLLPSPACGRGAGGEGRSINEVLVVKPPHLTEWTVSSPERLPYRPQA
ncbi:hypothetical protein CO2235_MP10035 [Cupriavidus oxalaticus]|uniref:Uncharacterized protein n=1 Tax=Cupriavidus oxalaticus TaxID=96344 RepID=A0A375GDV8_9BURK|nr:hypothetical protein CO2235_MP10035 [Cupriavidus oxalaticus]